MFRTRLISGIILVLIALATIMTGGIVLVLTLGMVSLIAYRELTKACGVGEPGRKINMPETAGMAVIVLYYAALFRWSCLDVGGKDPVGTACIIVMMAVSLALVTFLFIYVFTFPKYKAGQIMAAMFSFLYAPLMLSFIFLIREGFNQGIFLVWYIFLCSWGSDTCAYVVGVLFGRHKMTPRLSPKKSVEGAIGGIVGAALLFVLYTHFVFNQFGGSMPIPLALSALLGVVGALVSMVGDLAASAIKRDHDIKDYGKLIPGHGGIMDRFDSVIIVSPVLFIGFVFTEYFGHLQL